MTLDEQIAYWKAQVEKSTSDAWLIAFGVYTGLMLAKSSLPPT